MSNVCLPMTLRGLRCVHKAEEMLRLFGITHLRESRVETLSQGEKHRVALARAFVTEPELVLLDEPFSSLDPCYKQALIRDLRGIIKQKKITAVLVTQDQSEALALADTIAVMKDGRILQRGSPQEIFTRPASKEVADFVGIETVVAGAVVKEEEHLCSVQVGDKVLEVVSECRAADEVFVCIRPEDIVLSRRRASDSARNHFAARVLDIDPWRLEYKVLLDGGFPLVAFVTKQSVEELGLKPGQDVFVSFKATALHLIKR